MGERSNIDTVIQRRVRDGERTVGCGWGSECINNYCNKICQKKKQLIVSYLPIVKFQVKFLLKFSKNLISLSKLNKILDLILVTWLENY